MFRTITLVALACAGLGVTARGEEAAAPEVMSFVELVKSHARSATPLSKEQQHEVTMDAHRLRKAADRAHGMKLTPLADEAFLAAVGKLTSVAHRLDGNNTEDLDVWHGLSSLLETVFWSKGLSAEGAKRVLAAEIGILKRCFEEEELLKKAGASPGVVMIYNVVGEGPSAAELKKQAARARYNLVERAEWQMFESLCRALRKLEPGTAEQRKRYLMAAGLTAGEIEKCLRLGRELDAEAFVRHAPL